MTFVIQIGDAYIGFESGLFYGYLGSFYTINNISTYTQYGTQRISQNYIVNNDGSKGSYDSNYTYDCRVRSWYNTSKLALQQQWVKPYVSLAINNKYPAISLTSPLFKYDQITQKNIFFGAIGMTTYLEVISEFLVSNFNFPGSSVFIVDSSSGVLIATSIDKAALSVVTATGKNVSTCTCTCNSFLFFVFYRRKEGPELY